jgi:threonine/homoserine/homoserine lactone efflux protein
MPTAQSILLFMAAALALNLTPGPSILYILSRCMAEGRTAGIVSALGLGTAALAHAVAAALGLSTLFLYSPIAFALLKYLGAAYLLYLGLRGLFSGAGLAAPSQAAGRRRVRSLWAAYRQGVLTDLVNPKLALFFIVFLPQFADPDRGDLAGQILFFGLLFQVTGLPVNLIVAYAGGSLADLLRRNPTWARAQAWVSSTVLIGLGLRLAFAERR